MYEQMNINEIENETAEEVIYKQKLLILAHFEQGKTLTCKQAEELFGCMRLPARVWELNRAGFDIRSRMVKGVNRFGRPVRYAEYYVPVEEPKEAISVGCTVGDEDCWGGDVGTAQTFIDTGFGGD